MRAGAAYSPAVPGNMDGASVYLIRATREQLLSHLPTGEAVAEVGVANGAFSKVIAATCAPRRLILVDAWAKIDDPAYMADPNNRSLAEGERNYEHVRSLFADNAAVDIHRALSHDAARDVADGSLDWVYIDAMHTRDAVLSDLRTWGAKVRDDGLIMGHDYAAHTSAKKMGFGVVEAVHDYVRETGRELLMVTAEDYPSYVIAKNINAAATLAFARSVLGEEPVPLFHVTAPETRRFRQHAFRFPNGSRNLQFSWD